MLSKGIRTLVICALLISVFVPVAMSEASDLLVLAENGRSRYSIVISRNAEHGEDRGAKELALFLKEMTGAQIPIKGDDTPASDFEIVLGNTNRKSMADIPQEFKTDNWEGFRSFGKKPSSISWETFLVARSTAFMTSSTSSLACDSWPTR